MKITGAEAGADILVKLQIKRLRRTLVIKQLIDDVGIRPEISKLQIERVIGIVKNHPVKGVGGEVVDRRRIRGVIDHATGDEEVHSENAVECQRLSGIRIGS